MRFKRTESGAPLPRAGRSRHGRLRLSPTNATANVLRISSRTGPSTESCIRDARPAALRAPHELQHVASGRDRGVVTRARPMLLARPEGEAPDAR